MANPKIVIAAKDLYDAVSRASIWVERYTVNKALQGLKFDSDGTSLNITATDGISTDITLTIDVDGDGEFSAVLPASLLLSKLGIYAKSDVDVTMFVGKSVTLRAGKHSSRITLLDESYFPVVKRDFDYSNGAEIDVEEFARAVNLVIGAANPASPFPAVGGIYFNDGDIVTIDGIKIALVMNTPIVNEAMLVNAPTCSKIARALSGIVDTAKMCIDDKRFVVTWEGGIITSSLLNYDFPHYRDLMPQEFATRAEMTTTDLLTALKLISLETKDAQDLVILDFAEESLLVEAKSSVGTHVSEIDYTAFEGKPIRIGVSSVYLTDAVKKMENDTVEIFLNSDRDIVILDGGNNYEYGVMPMHIKE